MRLYTNNQGSWVGTQADAKREFGKDMALVDVPVSKEALLKWLNACRVTSGAHQEAAAIATRVEPVAKPHPLSCSANPTVYDIKDAALNSEMKHLTQAVAVWINRLEEEVL